jgi:hypothetical protein
MYGPHFGRLFSNVFGRPALVKPIPAFFVILLQLPQWQSQTSPQLQFKSRKKSRKKWRENRLDPKTRPDRKAASGSDF